MPVRQPIAAGRFYAGTAEELQKEAAHYLMAGAGISGRRKPWAFMLPHAGYIYCGDVIGKTLGGEKLADRLIILCPNHTGRGTMLSIWPNGSWLTPLGQVKVDAVLAEELIQSGGGFSADTMAHLGEHSIEVLLPFIQSINPDAEIVPVCVGTRDARALERAGQALARVLRKPENRDVGIIVSSDMNHYEDEKQTLLKDEKALDRALAADPAGLLQITKAENITMCGAAPLALALYAARDLGGCEVELADHSTSARASGDYGHVVGYAGLKIYH